ncbi:hypothetical protein EON81_15010 [bacterium]|nr:MAG: hypothetical protein EON81_15010 [bacterium]
MDQPALRRPNDDGVRRGEPGTTIQDGPKCVTVTHGGDVSTIREKLLRWSIGEREAASSS